ncbi:MAG TPA: DNA-binding protein, partial [Motiliproteus sp.]
MKLDTGLIHRIADRLLNDGVRPAPELIEAQLGCTTGDPVIRAALEEWWHGLAGRVVVMEAAAEVVPDHFNRAIKLLWQDAVREATRQVNSERQSLDESLASIRRESESAISGTRADYDTLEYRYQQETARADEAVGQVRLLEAELNVLKSNLNGEIVQRKQYEGKIADYKNDARRSEKQIEEARKLF